MPNPLNSGLPNEADLTDSGETLIDNITCLEWQKSPPPQDLDLSAAVDYCSALSLAGHSDWRLPTRIELTSLRAVEADLALENRGSWTKSTYAGSPDGSQSDIWIWRVYRYGSSRWDPQSSEDSPRCVRGGGSGEDPFEPAVPPPNQYSEVAPGEIKDNYTGLIWQQGQSEDRMLIADAGAYCAALVLGGNTWRLPTPQELATLVDEARITPAINLNAFPDTRHTPDGQYPYWGLAPAVRPPPNSLYVSVGQISAHEDTTDLGWVRCVR